MAVIITSKNNEKVFSDKNFIIIGSNSDCDYPVDVDFDLILTVKYDEKLNKCVVVNDFANPKVLFRGEPFLGKLVVDKFCKLKFAGSEDFLGIKIEAKETPNVHSNNEAQLKPTNLVNDKLDEVQQELETARISVVKQISFAITDIRKRLAVNNRYAILLNIVLVVSAVAMMFGVTNYLMGLPISDTVAFLTMPTNIKMLIVFSLLGYTVSLALKQGVFLFLQNKDLREPSKGAGFAQYFLIIFSTFFMCVFYAINLIYYMNPDNRIFYSIIVSLIFVLMNLFVSAFCGYFKYRGHKLSYELDKYEYREDLEIVLNRYQNWIRVYLNNLSKTKIEYLQNKNFTLQIVRFFKTMLGFITAPVVAYGVSNTLAMCFPEAAGWIRISSLRFSLVFLILSSLLIVFAFFAFSNAFVCIRKINGSDIIKFDGFRDYFSHGTDIFGLQKTRALNGEKIKFLVIGISIILIEFTMNMSFFMTEIGADLNGILLSLIAASLPTAFLLAETNLLSVTNYELYICDSIMSKMDR